MSIALLPSQLASIGKLLKEARELRGESLAQVATRIALTPAQLRAIEAGDLQPFYGPKYYDQAASRYAEALGVELPKPAVPEQLSLLTEPVPEKAAVAEPPPKAPAEAAHVTPAATPVTPLATTYVAATSVAPLAATPSVPSQYSTAPAQVRAPAPPAPSQGALPSAQTRVAAAVSSHNPPDAPATQIISPKTWLIAAALALITLGVVKVGTNQAPQPQLSVASLTPPVTSAVTAYAPAAPQPPPAAEPAASPVVPAPPPPTAAATRSTTTAPPTTPLAAPPPPAAAATPPPASPSVTTPSAPSAARTPLATTSVARNSVESGRLDSHLEAKASTWVQIVHADGSKTNLRIEPGERVEFNQRSTAAVAFGKPGQISLNIAGRAVDVQPYILQTSPARALIIMSQLKD